MVRVGPQRPANRWMLALLAAGALGVGAFGWGLLATLEQVASLRPADRQPHGSAVPRTIASAREAAAGVRADDDHAGLPGLEVMVARLEVKLAAGNGTADQWMLLGRTYRELLRDADALKAFEQVRMLDPGMPGVDAEWAGARNRLQGSPTASPR